MRDENEPGADTPPNDPALAEAQARVPFLGAGVSATVIVMCALILATHAVDAWAQSTGNVLHGYIMWAGGLMTAREAFGAPEAPLGGFSPYVLHVFVHGGWWHAFLNVGALLAFGSPAAKPFGRGISAVAGFLAFYFTCAIAGAGLHVLTHLDTPTIAVGASTATSGLLAAAGWVSGGRMGMLRFAMPWLLINAVIAVAGQFYPIPIAWAGHVGGLLAGMLLYPVFVRVFQRR